MSIALEFDCFERVIAKAWADEDFKAALLADPKAALKTQGIELPESLTLNVLENSESVFNLVLPKQPELALAGEALDRFEGAHLGAGGSCVCSCICGSCACPCT